MAPDFVQFEDLDVIFLDMDGVLVDLAAGVADEFGIDVGKVRQHDQGFGQVLAEERGITLKQAEGIIWGGIRKLGAPFWEGLKWTHEGEELYELAHRVSKVCILTSPADGTCAAGKINWLRKRQGLLRKLAGTTQDYRKPPHRRFAVCPAKELMAHPRALLIDDHDKNIRAFKAAGGLAITWPQAWNSATHDRQDVLEWLFEIGG